MKEFNAGVWWNGITSRWQREIIGSIPIIPTIYSVHFKRYSGGMNTDLSKWRRERTLQFISVYCQRQTAEPGTRRLRFRNSPRWPLLKKENMETYRNRLTNHLSKISCLQVLPNGRLVSGSHDNTIKIWK